MHMSPDPSAFRLSDSDLPSAAKSSQSNYQSRMFVCNKWAYKDNGADAVHLLLIMDKNYETLIGGRSELFAPFLFLPILTFLIFFLTSCSILLFYCSLLPNEASSQSPVLPALLFIFPHPPCSLQFFSFN